MSDVLQQIDQLQTQAAQELSAVKTADQLEQFRIKFLGSNGLVSKGMMKLLGSVPREQKPAVGQRANAVKQQVTAAFENAKTALASAGAARETVDVTEPGRRPRVGNEHILMKVTDELTELFGRMGFAVATGPEVEDEFHNFVALNIPKSHPARDPLDNFYLSASSVGIAHQLEALVVDHNVTMVDLKSTIMQFIHAYFGPAAKARFRPSFFPFTEPSAEVDVYFEDRQRWVELGGCGMVHPNVLRVNNIDPEEYSGWAFGFGIERIAMRKYAIDDIRYFIENDIRFLRQF